MIYSFHRYFLLSNPGESEEGRKEEKQKAPQILGTPSAKFVFAESQELCSVWLETKASV